MLQWNDIIESEEEDEDFHNLAMLVLFPRKKKQYQERKDYFQLDDEEFFLDFALKSIQCNSSLIRSVIKYHLEQTGMICSVKYFNFSILCHVTPFTLVFRNHAVSPE